MSDDLRLSKMLRRYNAAKKHVDDCEEALKEAKAAFKKVDQDMMPALMDELGYESITLSGGEKVSVVDEYYCSIAKRNRPAISSWLADTGNGALVTRDVIVSFSWEDRELADDIFNRLSNYNPTVDFKINTNSVKAAAKEMIGKGQEVPMDLLGLQHIRHIKVK